MLILFMLSFGTGPRRQANNTSSAMTAWVRSARIGQVAGRLISFRECLVFSVEVGFELLRAQDRRLVQKHLPRASDVHSAQSSSLDSLSPCCSQTLLHRKSQILCNNSQCPRREITLHLQSTPVYRLGIGRSESSVTVCIPQVPE